MTVTVSQRAKTSSKRWEMNTSARPSSRRLRATAKSRSTSTPLSAAVGSSMTSSRAARVDVDAETGEQAPGLGVHRGAVDATGAAQDLSAHEDVLGDREVGEEG